MAVSLLFTKLRSRAAATPLAPAGRGRGWGSHRASRQADPHGTTPTPSAAPQEKGGTRRRRDTNGGFTLVELLVVLVILGLVMGLVGPRVLGYLSSSRERTAHLQIESFNSALDLYFLDNGRYPTNSEGLEALVRRPASAPHWAGPYLKQANVPVDPWGNGYTYHVPGKAGPYAISSGGPDGKGGSSEHAAIGTE